MMKSSLFIFTKLKQIELIKEVFVLDMEQGNNVLIPPELSVNTFCLSYRYYDSILQIVHSMFNPSKKDVFDLRNKLNISKSMESSTSNFLMHKLGLAQSKDKLSTKAEFVQEHDYSTAHDKCMQL